MKTTLGKLVPALASGAMARLSRLDFPGPVAYALKTLHKSARDEGATYDSQRLAMLNKYGTPIEGSMDFKLHDAAAYNTDLEALHAGNDLHFIAADSYRP